MTANDNISFKGVLYSLQYKEFDTRPVTFLKASLDPGFEMSSHKTRVPKCVLFTAMIQAEIWDQTKTVFQMFPSAKGLIFLLESQEIIQIEHFMPTRIVLFIHVLQPRGSEQTGNGSKYKIQCRIDADKISTNLWTSSNGFSWSFRKQYLDCSKEMVKMKGMNAIVSVVGLPPLVVYRPTGIIGVDPEIMGTLADQLGFSFRWKHVRNWGTPKNGTWSGLVGDVCLALEF